MAQMAEYLILSDNEENVVIAPFYLWLEGRAVPGPGPAPGWTWKLRGSSGEEALVQSHLPTEDKIVGTVEATE